MIFSNYYLNFSLATFLNCEGLTLACFPAQGVLLAKR